jgi:hypothetical protein
MIRYLTLAEVIELHRGLLEQVAGSGGIRDLGALESAISQPRMTFSGAELYPTIFDPPNRSNNELVTTLTELSAIIAPAAEGLSIAPQPNQ